MRVLLDERLPRRLKRELVGHDARTVPEMGRGSKRKGELLALAATEFDVFLTADRNLSYLGFGPPSVLDPPDGPRPSSTCSTPR